MDHSYTMTQWQDAPSTDTPLSADNLNHIEQGIGAIYHDVGELENSMNTLIVGDLLPLEDHASSQGTYIATHDYSADDLMIIDSKIYKALSAITSGALIIITSGSSATANVSEITLGEAVVAIVSKEDEGLETRISAVEADVSDLQQVVSHLSLSHVGQIIHSTTLDTMAKVINVYGGTTWIQHSGYFLHGASSGVTPNSAADDGGEAMHTLNIDEMPSHTHTQNPHRHNLGERAVYVGNGSAVALVTYDGGSDNNALSGYTTVINGDAGGGYPHNNMPPFKNVYIWERTA